MAREFKNINLKPYNSFGVEVQADRLIEFDSYDDLHTLLENDKSILAGSWGVLSGGNNTLFVNEFKGALLHPVSKNIEIEEDGSEWVIVRVEAGVEWDEFVQWSVEKELWGLENLSLIPGYVGATPIQNIGAYGAEVKDSIVSIEMLCADTLNKLVLANEYCSFGYRDSIFKNTLKGRVVITSVRFKLSKIANPRLEYGALFEEVEKLGSATLQNIRSAVINIRQSKLPETKILGNAGSFFKNPVVDRSVAEKLKTEYPEMPVYELPDQPEQVKLAAGWLIEKCEFKGKRYKNAGVHSEQALVLVNHGGATGEEIMELANMIMKNVKKRFGVEISPEINIL